MCDTKKCSKCGEVKGRWEFYAEKRNRDGLASACKACHRLTGKKRRIEQRAHVKAVEKAYRDRNKERIAGVKASGYQRHRDAIRERQLDYYQRNQDAIKAKAAAWKRENPEKALAAVAAWQKANPLKVADAKRKYSSNNVERERYSDFLARAFLADAYVADCIALRRGDVPTELIAIKREQLAIKRMARELKKAATKPTGETQ